MEILDRRSVDMAEPSHTMCEYYLWISPLLLAMSTMRLYHFGAILKILVGVIILVSIYMTIYPQEDPAIALGFWFLGVFVISWGISFYIFYLAQYISTHKAGLVCARDAYKLSLLFGMYVLANVALLLMGQWTKVLGILLFAVFIGLQIFLSVTPDHANDKDGRQ